MIISINTQKGKVIKMRKQVKMKKLLAAGLALTMMIMWSVTNVSALERHIPCENAEDEEYVFVDASKDIAPYKSHDKSTQDSSEYNWYSPAYGDIIYGSSYYAYEWEPYNENRRLIASRAVDEDNLYNLSDYQYMNLRLYIPEFQMTESENSSSKRRIALRIHALMDCAAADSDCGSNGLHCLRYDQYDLASYEQGWHDISIPISSFVNKTTNNIHTDEAILSAVDYVEIGTTSIISAMQDWSEGETLYIDKIWFTKQSVSSENENYVIGDYTSGTTQSWGGAYNACYAYNSNGAFYPVDTSTTLNGASASVHWNNLNETTEISNSDRSRTALYARVRDTSGAAISKDLKEYKYVNAWIYSNTATTQNLELRIYYDASTDSTINPQNKTAGYHYLKSSSIQVNWTGWKLISVKISDMTDNMSQYGGLYSWDNGDMLVNATGLQAYNSNNCDEIDVNIDSIWYSIKDCTTIAYKSASTNTTENINGATVAPYEKTAVLTFTSPVDFNSAVDGIVVSNEETVLENGTDYTVQTVDENIYIHFLEDLEPNSDYVIEVKGTLTNTYHQELKTPVTISFKTSPICTIEWVNKSAQDTVIKAANNTSGDINNIRLLIGGYDADGRFVDVYIQPISVSSRETGTFSGALTGAVSYRGFVWNTDNTPMCEAVDLD